MADDEKTTGAGSPEQRVLSRRQLFKLSAGAAALAALGPAASGCGASGATGPLVDAPLATEPVVFVHISDSHFGGETSLGEVQDPAALKVDPKMLLTALFGEVVPAVAPLSTIHTGDLVNEGFEVKPWESYAEVFTKSPDGTTHPAFPSYPSYVEILGNHDVKFNDKPAEGDTGHGAAHFTSHSITGKALGSPADGHGITVLEGSGGSVCLIRTNTSESTDPDQSTANQQNIDGLFTETQRSALVADPAFNADAFLNVVLGHHPIYPLLTAAPPSPGGPVPMVGNAAMLALIAEAKAPLYLCGHVHLPDVRWILQADGTSTLMVQASTFGRHGQITSFFLVACDQGRPTAKLVYIDANSSPCIAWPQVLITAPASDALGGTNPNATAFATSATPRLRVMVFPPPALGTSEVTVKWVRAMIDSGREIPLVLSTGRLWESQLDLTGLAAGKHTVTVSAVVDVRSGADHHTLIGSDAIEITVGSGVPA